MVSATTFATTTLPVFTSCRNDVPIMSAAPMAPSAILATPIPPPIPTLENVAVGDARPTCVAELLEAGKKRRQDVDDKEFMGDEEYFRGLLAAREELALKYANVLKSLRTLRSRNLRQIRKRNNLRARKSKAARSAGTEAGAVATFSEATTTANESVVTQGSVERSVVGDWHGEEGLCASPVSMDEMHMTDMQQDGKKDVGKKNVAVYGKKEGVSYE